MKLGKMFHKKIDRDIKGVIKIGQDDEANVYQELEEYVVTNELNRHFRTFFESYRQGMGTFTDKMGVWISGFFGSGKSHFLKILSYLLENKVVEGKPAVSFFHDKISDPEVLANMEAAGDIRGDVILFNIDSKSDSDSKTSKEPVVRVFNKVFNEARGYSGSLPWLAELEEQMFKDGSYNDFKQRFQELANRPWESARADFYFEEDNIVRALADTTKMSIEAARNWYQKAEENYSLSIEKFANKVKEYIESKGNEHYVIFLVDEMGQYIGDDVGLMLNLQTLVEDLGTYCGGRAWVIVTSQQDIDAVTKVRGNDFSKIQGRFNTRLSLSSANVDEVIKKRLLYKNDVALDTLKLLYAHKEAILRNLITFSSDTPEKKTFKTPEKFVEVYPFIPYQFRLLQSVFTAIRQHGASGKHLSEGERSLLSAFQEAAVKYMDKEIGALIPFSAFYDTIETFLDHDIRTVFIHAEDNAKLTEMDIEVLKVLFLIKWVREIPKNMENVATLMVSHIDEDKIELKRKVETSLDKLVKQTLVQRIGEEYIFLTHEEQDVNKEIQNIPIDIGEIILEVGEEIFTGIYSERKFRYNGRYHFDFNKIIDDRMLSTQKSEIGVKVITPYFDAGSGFSDSELKMMSARENNLIIRLPQDTTFLDEMENVLKIQTYLTQRADVLVTDTIEEIRVRKSSEAAKGLDRVKTLLSEALSEADIFVNMQKVDIGAKNPVERINSGLKILIDDIYNKLGYITDFMEGDKDLQDLLFAADSEIKLFGDGDIPNKLAIDELIHYIEINTERHIPMTMKTILELYSKSPYGWRANDIRGLVIRLFRAQEISLQLGNDYLNTSDKDLIKYMTRKDYTDRLLIKKRSKPPQNQINNARKLARELFGQTYVPKDEDGLMSRFKELSGHEKTQIQELLIRYEDRNYPGKGVLIKGRELFKEIIAIRDPMIFFDKLYRLRDELLNYEENAFDVKRFFKNQKVQFDRAVKQFDIYLKNKTYVMDKEIIGIAQEIESIIKAARPYSHIPRLPGLIDDFNSRFLKLLEAEAKPVKDIIGGDWAKVKLELELHDLPNELYDKLWGWFMDLTDRLNSSRNFYEVIAMKTESDILKMNAFEEIKKAIRARKEREEKVRPAGGSDGKGTYVTKQIINVSIANMFRGTREIENVDDIEELLGYIRQQLKKELKENTIVRLI